ncbi:(2Fe-2S)-binding protein [Pseudonocardia sp. H11422]|uniref:(2Fe-2S)-binding protein n=1 Tax=Pseudonocardia sp. H11422 TaxID=2835866 RepID=UPI001BDBCA59|nr:(2Fe-2S)-binding protein [Pseudonocardia sp. H11422]
MTVDGEPTPRRDEGPSRAVTLILNGERVEATVEPRLTLLDFLREHGLTGCHSGCEHGVCGACTVLLDEQPVRACLVFAVQAARHSVETVEGLGTADSPHPLQIAFSQERALQCGFCTPGFLMLACGLLRANASPTDAEIRDAVASNLCRCTGYDGIVEAVKRAASAGETVSTDP